MCKAACFKKCRLFLFTLTWLSVSRVSFLASTNVRTICVVTVRINMANMVAIATLINIWEQKWIAKTLLDRDKHQISEFLKKEFCFYLWETSFCYLLSLMWWLYLGMSVRPQCILPYRCSCGSRQCWYNSQSRHKHGFYWSTHRYLIVHSIGSRASERKRIRFLI